MSILNTKFLKKDYKNKKNYFNLGFTIIEVLIVVAIFSLITGIIYISHAVSQKAYRESETAAEITQNGRVILERITREIRQAREMTTELSEDEPSGDVEPLDGIIFEDGHIDEPYHYVHYFKDGAEVKREVIVYYFSSDPDVYVPYSAEPPEGETLESKILDGPKTIGEYVTRLKFWGSRVIHIFLTLEKKDKTISLKTEVFGRNF